MSCIEPSYEAEWLLLNHTYIIYYFGYGDSTMYKIQQLFDYMTETIKEYFRRFDNSVTQSVYSTITMEEYYRNKAAFQFLDYDRDTLFRKNKLYCGIRNIDNSCYLSATLQILYNLQWLRERIFRVPDQSATEFLKQLQRLFALMHKGSLIYVDPTNLFTVLKKLHPQVFVVGNQNDFHQVFTIILDELQKSLTSEDDKRFFKKIFYGRMKVQLTDEKGKMSTGTANDTGNSFNLINLVSSNKSFENALKAFKNEIIDEYVNDSGQKVKASRQINFTQTPAILSFFINRVQFKDKKLVKDSSQFEFQQKILFSKTNSTKINKITDLQIQKQIDLLTQWYTSISSKKQIIQATLSYLQQRQFVNINVPEIQNPMGEQQKQNTKKYLKAELEQIDKSVEKTKIEIEQLQKKRLKEAQQSYSQVYNIWGAMIHCGTTAESGHYKICLKIDSHNGWVQFNDRRTQEITYDKILQYKKKGEICCLFYRRNTLVSQPEKAQIPSSLKKYVQTQQQQIFKKIDHARILQALYQEYESVNILWEFQNLSIRQQEKLSTYFFKPLLHLILSGTPAQTCKGYLLYETVQEDRFVQSIKYKFMDKNRQVKIPNLDFGIPIEYWNISQAMKEFLALEANSPIEAYELISFYMDITITNKITYEYFVMLRQVLVLKGMFYQAMFVEYNLLPSYEDFSKTIDRILSAMDADDPNVEIFARVRQPIRKQYLNKIIERDEDALALLRKQPSVAPLMLKEVGPTIFCKRFGFWIDQRKKIPYLNESILNEYKSFYPLYMSKIQ